MKHVIIILLIALPVFAIGQNEDVIDGLSATEFNGKVLLTWSVKKGNTCNGVEILHSSDSVNFTQIGSIEGICGSSAASIGYEFTHSDPNLNVVNYYRLHLGGVGFSWIVDAQVLDLSEANYVLRPNPVVGHSDLFFNNPNNEMHELTVLGQDGTQIMHEETNGDLFVIDALDLNPGLYFFTIAKRGQLPEIKGKLEVF